MYTKINALSCLVGTKLKTAIINQSTLSRKYNSSRNYEKNENIPTVIPRNKYDKEIDKFHLDY